jgi:hypothetical protein
MIELATIFIPIAIVCRNLQAESCELIRYEGYFLSQQQCFDTINSTLKSKLNPSDRGRMHVDAWCIDLEIEKVDKKLLPKPI